MSRNVYNSPNSPDNQDSNQNDGTGGLPEGRQPRSSSPSDNLPPRLTMEEMHEQKRIENQIREDRRRRFVGPSNGQAGGTERQWGDGAGAFTRAVRQRNDSNGVNFEGDASQNTGIAGLRGSQRIAEQIESGAPLNQIIPPQINNSDEDDAPPPGVDRPNPLRIPEAPIHEQRVAVPANTRSLAVNAGDVSNFFQARFLQTFTEQEQRNIFQAQQNRQNAQLTPEQQAGQQIILEAQQRAREAQEIALEAQQRAREAQQIAIELTLQRQATLPRPAPQPTATQNQGGQNRENTPEPFPIRPAVDRSPFPGTQPGGEGGERGW